MTALPSMPGGPVPPRRHRSAIRYHERRALGLCTWGGNCSDDGAMVAGGLCSKHHAVLRALERERYARRKAGAVCVKCGCVVESGGPPRCTDCRKRATWCVRKARIAVDAGGQEAKL